jgi:hypothetical protein
MPSVPQVSVVQGSWSLQSWLVWQGWPPPPPPPAPLPPLPPPPVAAELLELFDPDAVAPPLPVVGEKSGKLTAQALAVAKPHATSAPPMRVPSLILITTSLRVASADRSPSSIP